MRWCAPYNSQKDKVLPLTLARTGNRVDRLNLDLSLLYPELTNDKVFRMNFNIKVIKAGCIEKLFSGIFGET